MVIHTHTGCPPVISCFTTPFKYSYKSYKYHRLLLL